MIDTTKAPKKVKAKRKPAKRQPVKRQSAKLDSRLPDYTRRLSELENQPVGLEFEYNFGTFTLLETGIQEGTFSNGDRKSFFARVINSKGKIVNLIEGVLSW